MFVSSILAGAIALSSSFGTASLASVQPDPTRAPREAFTSCLHNFVNASVQARKSNEAFTRELAEQCQTEEQAWRAAMIRAELATRATQANAEEFARMEIEDARRNSRESFIDPQ